MNVDRVKELARVVIRGNYDGLPKSFVLDAYRLAEWCLVEDTADATPVAGIKVGDKVQLKTQPHYMWVVGKIHPSKDKWDNIQIVRHTVLGERELLDVSPLEIEPYKAEDDE